MGMLQLINMIVFGMFCGYLSSYIAYRRGRSPGIWFLVGITFNLLGVFLSLLMPKKRKVALVKEPVRLKAVVNRSESWLKLWYYMDSANTRKGPFDFPDFIALRKNNHIQNHSFVWGEGMKEWKKLSDLPELASELDSK